MLAFGAGDFGSNPDGTAIHPFDSTDGTAIHPFDSTNITIGSRYFSS